MTIVHRKPYMPHKSIAHFTSQIVELDGTRIHCWRGGPSGGTPVILWHGFLGTSYAWHKVAPALAGGGMDVLVPDMRGYGDSDKPSGVEGYDARALAEECRALAQRLDFGQGMKIVHVGHDMGAHPALLWTADHQSEVAGLIYAEVPVMLSTVMRNLIAYTPKAMAHGSLWWWVLALAPDAAERLIVGHERAFLTWFYERFCVDQGAIDAATVDEYLRTFAGRDGVLGAMGVYRAAFNTIAQTEPLMANKIQVPIVAMGGSKSLGSFMGPMLEQIGADVRVRQIADCGHFIPEEAPNAIVEETLALAFGK